MKRRLLIALLLFCLKSAIFAQYYSINVDYSTIEAMAAAYSAESATEALHNENIQKILERYKAAEVASAGIFSSKYLDRRALTSLDLWDSEQENRYYTRIYKIVSRRIIPKLVQDALLMVKDPSTAIYWGSYLVKTCDDVRSLCTQFESIVTNSRLNFNDIAFIQIADELKNVFNLTSLGDVDWKSLLESMGDDYENRFTKEKLRDDLDKLISNGVGLAAAGFQGSIDDLLYGTSVGELKQSIGKVASLASGAKGVFDQCRNLSAEEILTRFTNGEGISGMFTSGAFNISDWVTDYESSVRGQYYTQRVYIYRRDYGSETVCRYEPFSDINNVSNGGEWYRISTTDPGFAPNDLQSDAILRNSEQYAGWSRNKVNQLNSDNTPYNYSFSSTLKSFVLGRPGSGQYAKSYAYDITVTKTWDVKELVYEEVFDSYSMDWDTFIGQMNARLNGYMLNGDHVEITNTNELQKYISTHPTESSNNYYIGYDSKSYYDATDAKKLAGAATATFTVTCSDGGELGKGTTQYKCSDCGNTLSAHTKECSMLTTLPTESAVDISNLQSSRKELQIEAATIQAKLDALNADNSELLRQMSGCTIIEQEQYRTKYNNNKKEIEELNAQLSSVNLQIKDVEAAIRESEESESEETDDYYRIPQIMKSQKDAYGITWTNRGSWSGYTYTCNGTMGGADVVFTATLTMERKPSYFLGIKIHRAIIGISWKLTSNWTDSSVAEVLTLNPENSDEENSRIVNDKLSELARANPGCTVRVDIARTSSIETEEQEGVYHLLWASDRLEIARQIEARLAKIYTDLVTIEKFLHYKHGVIDWVRDLTPRLNADSDRKMTIAERSRRRWMHNLGSAYYEREEEDEE